MKIIIIIIIKIKYRVNSDLLLKGFNLSISGDRPLSSIHRSYILASQTFSIDRNDSQEILYCRVKLQSREFRNRTRKGGA